MIQFSSTPHLEFPLDSYLTKREVKDRIKRTVFRSAYFTALLFFWAMNDLWTEGFLMSRHLRFCCAYTDVMPPGREVDEHFLWSIINSPLKMCSLVSLCQWKLIGEKVFSVVL